MISIDFFALSNSNIDFSSYFCFSGEWSVECKRKIVNKTKYAQAHGYYRSSPAPHLNGIGLCEDRHFRHEMVAQKKKSDFEARF